MTVSAAALTTQVEAVLQSIAADRSWREPHHFARRAELAEQLEVHVLDRLELAGGTRSTPSPYGGGCPEGGRGVTPGESELEQRAKELSAQFSALDEQFCSELRARIRSGALRGPALYDELMRHAPRAPSHGYDCLDTLVDGIFRAETDEGDRLLVREPEMVFYQPTPVRVTLELARTLALGPDDLFCDLGSGLGQVCMLIHLLTGARARAVEFQPSYCDYARHTAEALGVPLEVLNEDARVASTGGVTVFYLYTPFRGAMLDAVLARLECTNARICTFGDCTGTVAGQPWLKREGPENDGRDRAVIFRR